MLGREGQKHETNSEDTVFGHVHNLFLVLNGFGVSQNTGHLEPSSPLEHFTKSNAGQAVSKGSIEPKAEHLIYKVFVEDPPKDWADTSVFHGHVPS